LAEIVEGISKAADIVSGIADASEHQATGIKEVNRGIEDVSQVIQSNSATSEESAASSEELFGQADMLKNLVAQFKLDRAKPSQGSANAGRALPQPEDPMEINISLDFEGGDKY
ncbi:MAG: hypothetical protein IJU59_06525, partial [Firmicutes bacterium]|nr:hypothetical protein [Bacillota bacterium]